MNYLMKKAVNLNGQDMMLAPLDIDFAHRTISLTGEIDEDVATVMNSSLRCLARDSDDPESWGLSFRWFQHLRYREGIEMRCCYCRLRHGGKYGSLSSGRRWNKE